MATVSDEFKSGVGLRPSAPGDDSALLSSEILHQMSFNVVLRLNTLLQVYLDQLVSIDIFDPTSLLTHCEDLTHKSYNQVIISRHFMHSVRLFQVDFTSVRYFNSQAYTLLM